MAVRLTARVEKIIEGAVFADDVEKAAANIQTLAATGSRALIVQEAGRLGVRATKHRAALREIAGGIEQ